MDSLSHLAFYSFFTFASTSNSGLNVNFLGLSGNPKLNASSGLSTITRMRSVRPPANPISTGTDILNPSGTSLCRTFSVATYLPSAFGEPAIS